MAKKQVTLEDVRDSIIKDLEKVLEKVKKTKRPHDLVEFTYKFDSAISVKTFDLIDAFEKGEDNG